MEEAILTGHERQNRIAFEVDAVDEQEFFRWQTAKITLIQQTLKTVQPTGTLADVGCFTGCATTLYRGTGFSKAVGMDASTSALERVRRRGLEGRLWIAGSEPCPASDREFDVVVAADIIEHIVDTDYFLNEIWRITKSDGHVIVTTPNLAFWLSRIRLLLGKTPWSYPGASPTVKADVMIDLNHIRVSNQREWRALFESRGFKVERVNGWSILPAIGGNHLRRMIDRIMTRRPALAFGLLFLLRKN